ncbi:MAG TPA: hypothetical protein VHW25_17330 [Steroidobacteraceae bacterium]|nr:hypothetical protein [Steroidobacteraceae bacterium]
MSVLIRWREQSGCTGYVFDVATSFKSAWDKILKRARINNFRWHDLRHHLHRASSSVLFR